MGFVSPTLYVPNDTLASGLEATRGLKLTIKRSSRFAFFLPLRVVFGFERAALNPPATRSGSRRLNGFLNPVLLVFREVVARGERVRRDEEENRDIIVWMFFKPAHPSYLYIFGAPRCVISNTRHPNHLLQGFHSHVHGKTQGTLVLNLVMVDVDEHVGGLSKLTDVTVTVARGCLSENKALWAWLLMYC